MCGVLLCFSQNKKNGPHIKVKDPKQNFGHVEQGKIIKIEYYFENAGTQPLIISDIKVTCGCTVAEFPHHPIKPGDSGIIPITFNTKEKMDIQNRTVEVISNAVNSPTVLRFKGVVKKAKEDKKN